MKKYLKIIICFALIFNLNNKADAFTGVGPIKFDNATIDHFFAYLRGDGQSKGEVGRKKGTPIAFAVNPEGTWSHYYYCPIKFSGNCAFNANRAVSECTKGSLERGSSRCKLFARGYKIVWGGENIRLSRKFDEQIVLAIFKENGWYEEFSNSTPPSGSGENKYIQKKKKDKNNSNIVKKSKNENIIEEIKELKKLLDEGILTEDEFENAKKKLLE